LTCIKQYSDSPILLFWIIDEPIINLNARDVGYLEPLWSSIFLATFFQQRTIPDGKLVSFSQLQITKYSREARFSKPLEDKHFKFGKYLMERLVRDAGSIISEKDTTCEEPSKISSSLREVSLYNPHLKKASLNNTIPSI